MWLLAIIAGLKVQDLGRYSYRQVIGVFCEENNLPCPHYSKENSPYCLEELKLSVCFVEGRSSDPGHMTLNKSHVWLHLLCRKINEAIMLRAIRSFIKGSATSFQCVSDLHLEINQQYAFELPVSSKHLVLAGDIGRLQDYDKYHDFLERQASKFDKVFLVLGNHEFYNQSFESGLERAKQLERASSSNGRIILLNQTRYDMPDTRVTILGCTLWSRIPEDAREIVHAKIQDFKHIQDWSIDKHNAAHESDLAWLRQEVRAIQQENNQATKKSEARSIVVVTHHAPSLDGTSSPQHSENPWRSAFGTDVLSENWKGVKAWVFGHTHYTTEFEEGGIKVVSNQRGYVLPWTKETGNFDPNKVFWV